MHKLTHREIVNRQNLRLKQPRLPLTVVLNNIRSLHNVGAIFRTADGVGVEKIWLCGITGFPPQSQISKTALGAEDRVPWDHHPETLEVVVELKRKNYQIVLLEQMTESIEYHRFKPKAPVCLVVGNEIEGVQERLLALCDASVEIPMMGIKNSLNVAVAFGIVAYHFRTCLARNFKNTLRYGI